ncbi:MULTISPECIES: thiamine pyrophosphate-binding protein [unclassified Janthinobacterium]|uniref:thiamine pyrophosphate-binding protein n=1 Tax=unclassified Janthinobacterium TaxID=2610881 RepID=UPI00160A2C75|nr:MULTISPECIES: thiamine pyrophosphate-binding protein [unclassified Janthinobacterium]MBB5370570.1 acetolactate synthase-1/2/3 large subunit [Janthinobacterium sp. K2C7]MBB5383216.1 acetolactate synthase-1/2/3 large subunit [Janthinobacterium sp. K2Li3]MBB5388670.1 acetolactate synthase-1/2/3 large subunit [Janthinobacterium sp. K2E3]
MTQQSRTGGQILVDALQIHGVDTAFGVPGESYLDVLDALHDSGIRFIINRQEGGAAFMAEAYGKLTGKPGICFVTRGPGATNASIGVHTAYQDSTPMVLFIGQVGNDFIDREAFQEIDYRRMYGQMAKWVAQIDRAERIPEYLAHAFQVATSGRPGPVVLALPEDMLTSLATVADTRPYQPVQAAPSAPQMAQLRSMLASAQRPLLLLGGATWTPQACADLQRFAEANHLPVACAFRFQDLLDNAHPNYIGDVGIGINPKLAARVKQADLVIAIGPRLGEMTTGGYTLFASPVPRQRLVHFHTDALELGSVYQAELMINSGMPQACAMLAALEPVDASAWQHTPAEARAELAAWQQQPPVFQDGQAPLDLWQVTQDIMAHVPHDTIVTNGAGNYASWAHRFHRYGGLRTQLAPTNGAMGYGLPSGVAAKIVHPERTVITFAGDGEYLMNGQELATAVQYKAGLVIIVFNNQMFGTIRMHQERDYPGRVSGTTLHNPDFAALAQAYGAHGEIVNTTAEFAPALQRALAHATAHSLPALIELRYDGNLITPNTTLAAIRATAEKARAEK